jgi:hypothetical protein
MNPHSHSPTHPPKYCLYIDKDGKDIALTYRKLFGAAKVIDIMLGENLEYEWIGDDNDMILTPDGITIRCSQLNKIMDYEYKGDEQHWEPDKATFQNIQYLLYGEASEESNQEAHRKVSKVKKKIPKHAEESYLGVPEIARLIEKTPQKTRQLLRKLMAKPDHGWKFKKGDETDKLVAKLR